MTVPVKRSEYLRRELVREWSSTKSIENSVGSRMDTFVDGIAKATATNPILASMRDLELGSWKLSQHCRVVVEGK